MQTWTFPADTVELIGNGLVFTRDDDTLMILVAAVAAVHVTDGRIDVTTTAGRYEITLPKVRDDGPHPVGLRNSLRGMMT